MTSDALKIWIDLENSPHVLFFEPIVRSLRELGHEVSVTARDFSNTVALASERGLDAEVIGSGYDRGRNGWIKRAFFLRRREQLVRYAKGRGFDVAASHGARTQAAAALRLAIPIFASVDYEHVDLSVFQLARCFMIPSLVSAAEFAAAHGIPGQALRHYDGLKEHVYLEGFGAPASSSGVRAALGFGEDEILVTVRPISEHAHYGNGNGDSTQQHLLEHLMKSGARLLVVPRTRQQAERFEAMEENGEGRMEVIRRVVDGPSLIAESDLVVSGGGTMIREAAVLGVPAVSCFSGSIGAVDRELIRAGRVALVRNREQAEQIVPLRRSGARLPLSRPATLEQHVRAICETADRRTEASSSGSGAFTRDGREPEVA